MKSSSVHEDRMKQTFQQLRHSLHQNLSTGDRYTLPWKPISKGFSSSAQRDPSSQGLFTKRKFELCND